MDLVYYPQMYLTSETLVKTLLLVWGKVRTILPHSEMKYISSYLRRRLPEVNLALDMYNRVNQTAQEEVLGFVEIQPDQRMRAANQMLDFMANWSKDARLFDSLRINSVNDVLGRTPEYYWFLNDKAERPLVELLLEERLAWNWDAGEVVCLQEVGRTYMGIVAKEIQRARGLPMMSDDDQSVVAKLKAGSVCVDSDSAPDAFHLACVVVPELMIPESFIAALSLERVLEIRKDLVPLAEAYHSEIARYQNEINALMEQGRPYDAVNTLAELCERISLSFTPLAKEWNAIARISTHNIALVTGVAILKPFIEHPTVKQVLDVINAAVAVTNYAAPPNTWVRGFDYLATLNRKLQLDRATRFLTALVPKNLPII